MKIPTKNAQRKSLTSDGIFAELGLPGAENELLKARLTLQIYREIRSRKLTQKNAGKLLGISQPHVSELMRGRARAFSAERLLEFLTALGHDVEIRLKPARRGHGEVSVIIAA